MKAVSIIAANFVPQWAQSDQIMWLNTPHLSLFNHFQDEEEETAAFLSLKIG